MSIVNGKTKHCPGCCEPGEDLPINEFTRSSVTSDGRSKYCVECQKMKLGEMPVKENPVKTEPVVVHPVVEEKKRRGMPKGGWPKKDAISPKIDPHDEEMSEPGDEIESLSKPDANDAICGNDKCDKYRAAGWKNHCAGAWHDLRRCGSFREGAVKESEQAPTLTDIIKKQMNFSFRTFGPGTRSKGIVDHIRKELTEIEAAPKDLSEWIDVVILALDGAWRAGYSADDIVNALIAKQAKNQSRKWPDWKTAPVDKAIEHIKDDGQPELESNLTKQVGGDHYTKMGIYQPWVVLSKWMTDEELKGAMKKDVSSYIAREKDKGGRADIKKAYHTMGIYLELTKHLDET